MAKIIICPDVHGRKFWHKAKEMIDEVDKVVFLGDYLDPYNHEGITFEEALNEFKQILNFKATYSDKVVLLVGNHDMHYILTNFMDCSRRNYEMLDELHTLYVDHLDKFELVYQYEEYLFSHAGVYKSWFERHSFDMDELFDFKAFLIKRKDTLEDLSFFRGGYNTTGSCVWADIRESLRNEPLEEYIHIVGHTQLNSSPYVGNGIICVDIRNCLILNTEIDGPQALEIC